MASKLDTPLLRVATFAESLVIARGSVVDYQGQLYPSCLSPSAIVNAANEGCVNGGGVDGAINSAGGPALLEARKALPVVGKHQTRCPVGEARTTIAGNLRCDWVIHAVGPNYRLFEGEPSGAWLPTEEADALLYSAYRSAMAEARRLGLVDVAFSLISAAIFRGSRPLEAVLRIGVLATLANAYPGLKEVVLVAFTEEEERALVAVAEEVTASLRDGGSLTSAAALRGVDSGPLRAWHEQSLEEQSLRQTAVRNVKWACTAPGSPPETAETEPPSEMIGPRQKEMEAAFDASFKRWSGEPHQPEAPAAGAGAADRRPEEGVPVGAATTPAVKPVDMIDMTHVHGAPGHDMSSLRDVTDVHDAQLRNAEQLEMERDDYADFQQFFKGPAGRGNDAKPSGEVAQPARAETKQLSATDAALARVRARRAGAASQPHDPWKSESPPDDAKIAAPAGAPAAVGRARE